MGARSNARFSAVVGLAAIALALVGLIASGHSIGPRADANSSVVFEDEFGGTSIDGSKWTVFTNGYPPPTAAVSGGFLELGQPGAGSLDFPYVLGVSNPFPTMGSFQLDIDLQFNSTGGNGAAFQLVGPSGEFVAAVWQDSVSGQQIFMRGDAGIVSTVSPPTAALHRYSFAFDADGSSMSIDSVEVLTGSPTVRPAQLWLGHPSLGQVFAQEAFGAVPQSALEAGTGIVLSRWWGASVWSTLRVDAIRVTGFGPKPTPTPTPTTTPTSTPTPCPDFDSDSLCDNVDPDDDSDGCPDAREQQTAPGSEASGGRRDFHNPWDYFNPTQDGINRMDDISAVLLKYGHDQDVFGDYDVKYDRTGLPGGHPWQFGPPDGIIRTFEITAAVLSYGHDCS